MYAVGLKSSWYLVFFRWQECHYDRHCCGLGWTRYSNKPRIEPQEFCQEGMQVGTWVGSCLLWVMSTEISVDIAVDIAVDSRSIVGRQSVDSRSTVGR